jgi:hypothetical protein
MNARDLESLSLFLTRLARIQRTRLVQLINAHGLNVEIWERPDGEYEVVFPEISETDLDAFLFNWRLFVQKKDRISIFSIKQVVFAARLPVDLERKFTTAVNTFNDFLESPPLMKDIRADTNQQFLDTLLYGQFAHIEAEKYNLAQRWEMSFGRSELHSLFVATLGEASRLLFQFEEPVAAIMEYFKTLGTSPTEKSAGTNSRPATRRAATPSTAFGANRPPS